MEASSTGLIKSRSFAVTATILIASLVVIGLTLVFFYQSRASVHEIHANYVNEIEAANAAFEQLMPRLQSNSTKAEVANLHIQLDRLGKSIGADQATNLPDLLDQNFVVFFAATSIIALLLYLLTWLNSKRIGRELKSSVGELYHNLEESGRAEEKLRVASEGLSLASDGQSGAVQESVAAITQIREMLGQTTSHVRECQKISDTVSVKINDAWSTMKQMQSAMGEIELANSQLQQVEEIISGIKEKTQVINDIVFKTQLLSFNASIEAARAGQYGRGFAVVAEEVGNLAQLSGDASRDIEALLQDSQKTVGQIVESVRVKVSEGKKVAGVAAERFSEVSSDVVTISSKVTHVGEATLEQEGAITQTAMAMEEVNKAAEANRRGAKEILDVADQGRSATSGLRTATMRIQNLIEVHSGSQEPKKSRPAVPSSPSSKKGHRVDQKAISIANRLAKKSGQILPLKPKGKKLSADDDSFKKQAE